MLRTARLSYTKSGPLSSTFLHFAAASADNTCAQVCKTFAAMGAATALPEPPFSTNTTNATGQLLSSAKPANIAFAVYPSRSAVPDFAQTERPPNCQSP